MPVTFYYTSVTGNLEVRRFILSPLARAYINFVSTRRSIVNLSGWLLVSSGAGFEVVTLV